MNVNILSDGEKRGKHYKNKQKENGGDIWCNDHPGNHTLCGPDSDEIFYTLEEEHSCPETVLNMVHGSRDRNILQRKTMKLRNFLAGDPDFILMEKIESVSHDTRGNSVGVLPPLAMDHTPTCLYPETLLLASLSPKEPSPLFNLYICWLFPMFIRSTTYSY